ncbi:SCO family protein [Massilia sp. SYSU DXS3249]
MTSKRTTLMTLLASAATSAVSASTMAWEADRRSAADPRAAYFTNSPFIDHEGRPVRFYQDIIHDKVVVLNMMYTACTSICPGNTANLLRVQQALGDRIGRDVHMVSISLLPELDPPSALRSYMKRFEIGPGWTFLTGTRKSMDIVRRKIGFYDSDPAADKDVFRHTGMLSIGNDRIERWCMMPALSATHQIVRSIEELA